MKQVCLGIDYWHPSCDIVHMVGGAPDKYVLFRSTANNILVELNDVASIISAPPRLIETIVLPVERALTSSDVINWTPTFLS
jgi:hypothetical protein